MVENMQKKIFQLNLIQSLSFVLNNFNESIPVGMLSKSSIEKI